MTGRSSDDAPVALFAAGSLRAAMADLARAFDERGEGQVALTLGPSGLLRRRIGDGDTADLFAAADLRQPKALVDAGLAPRVVPFAGNQLCLLARLGVLDHGDPLDRLLDPAVRLGTSTPGADPCGDYAWEVFTRAETRRPGSYAALAGKALQLTGASDSPAPPAGRDPYAWLLTGGRADLLLTYRTNAVLARQDTPGLQQVALPDDLAIGATYGLALLRSDKPAAQAFADFVLSAEGQRRLATHGFTPAAKATGRGSF